jgi:hypothetical protein
MTKTLSVLLLSLINPAGTLTGPYVILSSLLAYQPGFPKIFCDISLKAKILGSFPSPYKLGI